MTGTAPPAARLLLVEQPGPWGPRGLLDSHAGAETGTRIAAAAAAVGMRLQAVRRPGPHADHPAQHRVGVADMRADIATTRWWSVPTLADLAAQLEQAAADDDTWIPSEAVADDGTFLLVCTHGRHDPCCALRGRPLVAALDQVLPGRVWETTHVGGDRFAANVLVLPSGALYGRVGIDDAARLVERVERGAVLPELLRGWFGLSPIAQAGLVHAHAHLDPGGAVPMRVTAVRRVDDARAHVVVRTPQGEVVVEVATAWAEPAQLTCHGPATARARAYRGLSVTPVAGPSRG